jgi:hypothetical protein
MAGGFTPRFAFEVVFLVLLAVAAGLADLRPLVIGLVMGGAWVLVVLIEWLAWRAETRSEEPPPAWTPPEGEGIESTDSWEIDEILAPLPEESSQADDESRTSVLPPAEKPKPDEPKEGDGRS